MVRYLAWAMALCLLTLLSAIGIAAYLAIDDRPMVNRKAEFTPAHIERAIRIAEKNDPHTMRSGVLRTISLSQEDLDLALNYLAGRYAGASTRIALLAGTAAVAASFELPPNPLGGYLNLTALLHETAELPAFDYLQIGRLSVPAWLANMLLARALEGLNSREDYRIASDTIKKVSFANGRFTLVYDWQDDLPDRVRAVMLAPEDEARLRIYQESLAARVRPSASASGTSLAELMGHLFALAAERGVAGDPVAENRAAILVLTFYVNGKGLGAIIPVARSWTQPLHGKVILDGRSDFPQHFMVSAALAAYAGAPLADAIGVYKEVDDSRGGSGFSFNDIAADRAGTRFGELAAGSRESAANLQRKVGAGVQESDMMPPVKDLPEFMPEAEFNRRFGGIGAQPYRKMMEDIERRVAALPLYR